MYKTQMTQNTDVKNDIFYRLFMLTLKVYKIGGIAAISLAFVLLFINVNPGSFYFLNPGTVNRDTSVITSTVIDIAEAAESSENSRGIRFNSDYESVTRTITTARELPPFDKNLPTETILRIPSIGVDAIIHGGTDGDAALDKGVWQQSVNIDPTDPAAIVLASHRWGPITWSQDYRQANSFQQLPSIPIGSEIIIIHEQRQFSYKVISIQEAKGTIKANSDLILYTCKFFRSDDRIFVTAERNF